MRENVMLLVSDNRSLCLRKRLRAAADMTPGLMSEIHDVTRRRALLEGNARKVVRLRRFIDAHAWTDAALALIDLELPLWHIRRLAYDDGEWYCALSRERELPDWLDQCVETRHADLSLAISTALLEAQRGSVLESRPSVPNVNQTANAFYEPLRCDNFD